MKTIITAILLSASCLLCTAARQDTAQVAAITAAANMPRPGDRLEKFEIRYIRVGGSGDSLLWDLSGNEPATRHTIRYRRAGNGQLMEIENNSVKYYSLQGDTLYLMRHSQPGMSVAYPVPEAVVRFPMDYGGNSLQGYFYGEGSLGNVRYIRNAGCSANGTDGRGRLVTPEGDTISGVVRSHYRRSGTTLIDPGFSRSFSATGDSTLLCPDSIRHWLATDSITHRIDRWRWYARGYRYPVAEAETYKILYYGIPVDSVHRYYYYRAVDQQYDLEDDMVNQQIRDRSRYGQGHSYAHDTNGRQHGGYHTPNNRGSGNTPNAGGTETYGGSGSINNSGIGRLSDAYPYCTVSPTIVTASTTVCYGTAHHRQVDIRLYNTAGAMLWRHSQTCPPGDYSIPCPMDAFPAGEYLLVANIGNETFPSKVIKL